MLNCFIVFSRDSSFSSYYYSRMKNKMMMMMIILCASRSGVQQRSPISPLLSSAGEQRKNKLNISTRRWNNDKITNDYCCCCCWRNWWYWWIYYIVKKEIRLPFPVKNCYCSSQLLLSPQVITSLIALDSSSSSSQSHYSLSFCATKRVTWEWWAEKVNSFDMTLLTLF